MVISSSELPKGMDATFSLARSSEEPGEGPVSSLGHGVIRVMVIDVS